MPLWEHAYRHLIAPHGKLFLLALLLILAGCAPIPASCPGSVPFGLMNADSVNEDTSLPFRFPLDFSIEDENIQSSWFTSREADIRGSSSTVPRYHTGEDYHRSAGTPVFAIADGTIRYSGPTLHSGWLIAIDHPRANLYSLYSHLAVTGWHIAEGEVGRGDLIGYVGSPLEYNSSADTSSDAHLHFALRAGQWEAYPGLGEWRGTGIWTRRCPQDLGWLHPSITITRQIIPPGGFPSPEAGFFDMWWPDLLLTCLMLITGGAMILLSRIWNRPLLLIVLAFLMFSASVLFYVLGSIVRYIFFTATIILITIGIEKLVLRHREKDITAG